ncbi:MAG TPA: GTP 3',8-cyclase MoaA [Acidimicrobiales bacterium]|nr:GTP 3',8-cyclase MoaA [Acidimicrobiales bacterium]
MPEPLVDPFGRTVRDLRVSVTDRCNLRCRYCMSEEMTWLPRAELLTFEEIERIARVCVERFGFDGIRLTGGEPTVRAQLPVLVEMLSRLDVDLALTTNGATFAVVADDLRRAGLRRVNISCDSLRRDRYASVTRRDVLPAVLDGIDAAVACRLHPVKVNCVLIRGFNDDEVLDFATFGRERGVTIRFIEFMPLDAGGDWTADKVVPAADVVAEIDARYPLSAVVHGSEPARRYRYLDGAGEIGVIGSVTESFCGTCDRVRVTAEGMFRSCLFAMREADLRRVLRAGGSDDDLAAAISTEVGTKWSGHSIGQVDFVRPARSMSQIGG